MALATQCPHCHTTFRVAHDQLKLRAGLVRCGACKQIFNGIENLLRPQELAAATAASPVSPTPPTATRSEKNDNGAIDTGAQEKHSIPSRDSGPSIERGDAADADGMQAPSQAEPNPVNPLLRMTLMDVAPTSERSVEDTDVTPSPSSPDEPDPLVQAIEDLETKPWRSDDESEIDGIADELDRADTAGYDEPSFVKQGRKRQRIGRAMRVLMISSSILLFMALIAQAGYVFRNQIAAWFPQTQPLLAGICSKLGCQLGLPTQIDVVSIESSELESVATDNNTFTLSILLRNRGATAQAWPHIELTLNDANEKAIARHVFLPRDYLTSAQDIRAGIAPKSEQGFKLHFQLLQLKASGYRVYLFYP